MRVECPPLVPSGILKAFLTNEYVVPVPRDLSSKQQGSRTAFCIVCFFIDDFIALLADAVLNEASNIFISLRADCVVAETPVDQRIMFGVVSYGGIEQTIAPVTS